MNKYKRLTSQKWTDDIDLTKEYGYSYIYKRLYELEDKIENGTLVAGDFESEKSEIERLKAENASRQKAIESFISKKCCLKCDIAEMLVKEFCEQIEMSLYAEFDGMIPSIVSDKIDELLKDYGISDEVTSRINLRLGVTEKDIEIMAKALREYAKNHPNQKCHADEANDLADIIERQGQEVKE